MNVAPSTENPVELEGPEGLELLHGHQQEGQQEGGDSGAGVATITMIANRALAAGILNAAALRIVLIANLGWKCGDGLVGAPGGYAGDAPEEFSGRWADADNNDPADRGHGGNDDDDDGGLASASAPGTAVAAAPWSADYGGFPPAHLIWETSPAVPPADWSFQTPKFCRAIANYDGGPNLESGTQKIIVHFHMQHNAGTALYAFAKRFAPCATRACWQDARHCLVSANEDIEAENIRRNYIEHGVQYVSYEVMLPPRFPLPFVSPEARRGMFFTTIVRDPFKRFLTFVRRHDFKDKGLGGRSPFWADLQPGKQQIYSGDNLNARWLSGTFGTIGRDHINIAKCRLQLFDLVIADKLFDHAVKRVLCPLNGWQGREHCEGNVTKSEHKSRKPDPLKNASDPLLIGAWIERLRPSFEIYDYARILSWRQMKERGMDDLPRLSRVPSYVDALSRYTDLEVTEAHQRRLPVVSVANADAFAPPVEFCEGMKRVWTSNPDEIPPVFGIGSIKDGLHPKMAKRKDRG